MQHYTDFSLKNYTSFKIGGIAKNAYFPETTEEFVELLKTLESPIVLGGMSNVIISSNGIDNPIILTKKYNNFEINNEFITAQAGAMGPLVSKAAAESELSGMEFMCGFPGSIGGIVAMNAGAHGQMISDIFISAEVYDKSSKTIKTFAITDMDFSYRKSKILLGQHIVLNVKFKLHKSNKDEILNRMNKNNEFRKNKQPNLSKPNCGSVFKNPENDSAGRLLELVGAKNYCIGNAKVFENHANFIINTGNATSTDISLLMKKMYNEVKDKFGIKLKSEVRFIGKMNEVEREIWNELLNN